MKSSRDKILFVCVDMQERLLPVIALNEEITKKNSILMKVAQLLNIKTLITEQYPSGLGTTHPAILSAFDNKDKVAIMPKTTFSIFGDSDINAFIAKSGVEHIVLCGVETHICVWQSIVDALHLGLKCTLVADASSSRDIKNHHLAVDSALALGALALPMESVIFSWLQDCKNTHFKTISAMIK